MNIHEVVRATQVLEEILAEYVVDPATRLCVISHYQIELIERELAEPPAVPVPSALSTSSGAEGAPGMETGGRFKLKALTKRGEEKLPEVERMYERL